MIIRFAILLLIAVSLSACSSGFNKSTEANTQRGADWQDTMLQQATNDLTAINACFLRSMGYLDIGGTLSKVGEPTGSGESCTVMATSLRMTSTFLTAFGPTLVQPIMGRVPAAPEEIVADLLKFGMKFSLTKHGMNAVERVISSGQMAQAQTSAAALEAVANRPAPVLLTVPEGGTATILRP
jgi:hypothetical protein